MDFYTNIGADMHYTFPVINTIEDVLPHIEGRPEFKVMNKGEYTVINYMVAFEDTFKWNDDDVLGSSIRRECRGLIFNKEGNIISRAFHKFFNCNETPETQINKINLYNSHTITQKLDGSLIRFLNLDGKIVAATKAGVTEISQQVDEYLQGKNNYYNFIRSTLEAGFTACFEWCSRKNRIVIDYEEDQLILTAIRNTTQGNYIPYWNVIELAEHYEIPVVKQIDNLAKQNVELLVNQVRGLSDDEGIVIQFDDGHKVKIKADDYVLCHKTKDQISQEKNIISIILNNGVDDVISLLPPKDVEKLRAFEKAFWLSLEDVATEIYDLYKSIDKGQSQKDFATMAVASLLPKYQVFMYSLRKGIPIKDLILERIKNNLSSQTKVDENRWLWGGLNWNE